MIRAAVDDREREDLELERAFLLRSLEDLDGEYRAGDVSEEDYSRLRDQYTARAAEVLRAIDSVRTPAQATKVESDVPDRPESPGEPESRPASEAVLRRRRGAGRRRSLLWGGVGLLLAGAATAVVVSNTGDRLPGNTATGGISLSPGQTEAREVSQAADLEQEGEYSQALSLYEEVLAQNPTDALALSGAGWLEFEAGVLDSNEKTLEKGQSLEEQAVSVDPGYAYARALLGSMFFVEGDASQAVEQYSQFISDDPPSSEVSPFLADIEKAYADEKTPLPAGLGRSSSKSTGTSSKKGPS